MRLVRLTFVTTAIVLAAASPAIAKVPPFTVEVSPTTPVAGDTLEITVRFWDDLAHTDPPRWLDTLRWDEFLWAVPADAEIASAEGIPVDLVRARRGVYRGSVILPSSGRWSLCPFQAWPCRSVGTGDSGPLELIVLDATTVPATSESAAPSAEADESGPREGSSAPVAAAAVLAVVVAGAVGVRRSRRR